VISDEAIRQRTGRGLEEWFDLLDARGAAERRRGDCAPRRRGARIEALGWDAQAITVSYERARGLRAVGERVDGFGITASKRIEAPVERLSGDPVVGRELESYWPLESQKEELPEPTPPNSLISAMRDHGSRSLDAQLDLKTAQA